MEKKTWNQSSKKLWNFIKEMIGGVDYDYLLGMKIWSLTQEKKEEILKQRDNKKQELKNLQVPNFWLILIMIMFNSLFLYFNQFYVISKLLCVPAFKNSYSVLILSS